LLSRQYSRFEFYAFTLIIGGGIGNLIDRARFQYVVDFLYMGIGKIGTNIFNIADFVIVIGFVMMLWQWFRTWREQKSRPSQSPT
jgi:signal peptidase II